MSFNPRDNSDVLIIDQGCRSNDVVHSQKDTHQRKTLGLRIPKPPSTAEDESKRYLMQVEDPRFRTVKRRKPKPRRMPPAECFEDEYEKSRQAKEEQEQKERQKMQQRLEQQQQQPWPQIFMPGIDAPQIDVAQLMDTPSFSVPTETYQDQYQDQHQDQDQLELDTNSMNSLWSPSQAPSFCNADPCQSVSEHLLHHNIPSTISYVRDENLLGFGAQMQPMPLLPQEVMQVYSPSSFTPWTIHQSYPHLGNATFGSLNQIQFGGMPTLHAPFDLSSMHDISDNLFEGQQQL